MRRREFIILLGIGLAIGVVTIAVSHASADDTLKLAIPMRGNWENVAPDLGERAGIFKKHGLALEKVYTQGAGETLQVVVPGSADIGLGVGTSAVMAAFVKGAPVRVIGSSTTGTNDLYWYVRADSPIKSFKDATESTTVAYSTNGSSSHNFRARHLAAEQQQGKADRDGSHARDIDAGHERTDRHRLCRSPDGAATA